MRQNGSNCNWTLRTKHTFAPVATRANNFCFTSLVNNWVGKLRCEYRMFMHTHTARHSTRFPMNAQTYRANSFEENVKKAYITNTTSSFYLPQFLIHFENMPRLWHIRVVIASLANFARLSANIKHSKFERKSTIIKGEVPSGIITIKYDR